MARNQADFEAARVAYHPYVEPAPRSGAGLVEALARTAVAVVTDDFPRFFIPRMIRRTAERLPVQVEAVDSNCLFPMRATDRVFTTAHSYRRFLQRELPAHLLARPTPDPLADSARLMETGNRVRAVGNCEHSLDLNPDDDNGRKMLAQLETMSSRDTSLRKRR